MKTIRLWDLPTRLFHWLLVLAIGGAWITGEVGGNWLIWHGRLGIFIIGLIAFRLTWGLVGSTYARFSHFVRGPKTILAYLRGQWHGLGHNPLGALSVLGLLALVSFQALSGLMAFNDDTGFNGPLYTLISNAQSEWATRLHHKGFKLLQLLVFLHLAAIMYYGHVKKDKLLKPMITGLKEVSEGESARGGGALALIAALLIACAAGYAASGVWLPPPPPVAVDTPNW